MDIWSVGCVFAELLLHKALFKGKSEIDQLNQIFKELGTPNDKIWPGYSDLPCVKKVTQSHYYCTHTRNSWYKFLIILQYMNHPSDWSICYNKFCLDQPLLYIPQKSNNCVKSIMYVFICEYLYLL